MAAYDIMNTGTPETAAALSPERAAIIELQHANLQSLAQRTGDKEASASRPLAVAYDSFTFQQK